MRDVLEEGIVLRAQSGHCFVEAADGRHWHCLVRGRFKSGPRTTQTVVVAGDRVRVRPLPGSDGEAVLEEVLPRRNHVSRRTSRRDRGRHERVLMANLDQVMVVQSVSRPAPRPGFVDRLLAAAEQHGVTGLLCLNKCDLDPRRAGDPQWAWYERIGYPVLRTSAETGEGLEKLHEILAGRVTLLLGASGTGKSSLIARATGRELRIGAVTDRTGLGRHTTTHTELYPVGERGYITDSPGLRGFDLWDIAPQQLGSLFPDIRREAAACRFNTCLHAAEPGCGVKTAVAEGRLPAWRYRAYRSLLEEVMSRPRW